MKEIDLELKKKLFENYYLNLNEKQREAVLTYGGPLLVIAGAGSGKTTVLVNRICHLIHYGDGYLCDQKVTVNDSEYYLLEQLGRDPYLFPRAAYPPILKTFAHDPCPPDRILAITFTNKAAGEIKDRLTSEVGDAARDVWAGTFHSICVRLLKMFSDRIRYSRNFTIYDQDDAKKLITTLLKDREIDSDDLSPKQVLNVISKAKNAFLLPEEFEKKSRGGERMALLAQLYADYQKALLEADAMDFDDLILETVKLLQNDETARSYCQNKFRFVFVDEYQDTNHAQYLLMRLIADGSKNIMVVGDDDQSIYKFRGAAVENILNFDKQYPDAKVVMLEQNYRSTQKILDAANALIQNNDARRGKTLWCDNLPGLKPVVRQLEDQEKEAMFVVEDINRLTMLKDYKYRDFAVLYRTKAQANILETVFTKSGLPHRLLSGLRFYDHAEVKDIIAYLRLIRNPSDFISFSRIINVPRRGIGPATVEKIREIAEQNGMDYLSVARDSEKFPEIKRSYAKLSEFAALIDSFSSFSRDHSPSEIVHYVIDHSGYMQTLLGDENEERRKNVDELISSACFFEEKTEDGDLGGFLEEIALVSDVDNYDKSANSVVMMTVHAAKGLEFPVVYLVGMEENLFPSPQSAVTLSDLEEERRLAYVAMTRAKDELYLTCCARRLLYGKTNYNEISRFIREIPEEKLTLRLYKESAREERVENPFGFRPARVYSGTGFLDRAAQSSPKPDFSRKASTPPKPDLSFSEGDRVLHAAFGTGTVLSAKKYGADTLYEIRFDKAGTKKLMATYAKLKRAK